MEQKATPKVREANAHRTLFSTVFFTLGNIILLSLISCVILIVYFSGKAVLNHAQISTLPDIALSSAQISILRLKIAIANLPWMILLLALCVIDGLVQRDIRKFQCARESTFLFHRTKPIAGTVFFTLFFLYMAIPIKISFELFFVPMTLLCGLFITITIRNFKKYL